MSLRNLESLLKPRSVAVIGASDRPRSVGATAMANLLAGGFRGPVFPVNPKHRSVAGVLAYPDVESLPETPDLALVCTPPAAVPGVIAALGEKGAKAACVLTAGLEAPDPAGGGSLEAAMLAAARPYLLRILGPNCVGLLVPPLGLNASFAPGQAVPGPLAFLSQSGALCTAVLDWARARGIGFSHFVSLGNSADVDFGDLLDYLGSEPDTRAILLYIEQVKEARKFMSAARAAARNKFVLALKAGRGAAGQRAARSHTGALAGSDAVYEAALERAGILRVFEIDELFDAVETLARARPLKGERLAILTNGGGPAVMAADALTLHGGALAELSAETVAKLDRALPGTWSRGNPVDIIGDAPPERYGAALDALLTAPEADALLFIHAPTAIVEAADVAQAVAPRLARWSKPALGSFLGGAGAEPAQRLFADAGLPTYETPEKAARAFLHLVRYRRNQEALMETPPSAPERFRPALAAARRVVERTLAEGRSMLSEPEAKAVLAAYAIPVVETRIAPDARAARRLAEEIGYPVALKVLSPQIGHKSDVGGVALDLEDGAALEAAAGAMGRRVRALAPDAALAGFTVQPMARRPGAHELIVGMTTDSPFGPVLLFGEGGTAAEIVADRALALPPLNMNLARALIARTRIARLLAGYRDRPAADLDAVAVTLIKVAQLVTDIPEIVELDINPLLADAKGVVALDARMAIAPARGPGAERLVIRPYPSELEEWIELGRERVLLRPIRPEDEPEHVAFIHALTRDDIRFRFFGLVRELPHSEMARFTQIDYDREMAFIATRRDAAGRAETLGVVRAACDPDNLRAEFAIVVRSDLKGRGLGRILLEKMIRYLSARGTREVVGQVLADNERMLHLARDLGFAVARTPVEGAYEVRLPLAA